MTDKKLIITPFSFSYVAIWETMIVALPRLQGILTSSFNAQQGQVVETFSPEGWTIYLQGTNPKFENLTIGPQRLVVYRYSKETLLNTYSVFLKEIKASPFFSAFIPRNIGINLEFNVQHVDGDIQQRVSNRFIKEGVKQLATDTYFNDVSFNIVEDGDQDKIVGLHIQRNHMDKALVGVNFNDHYGKSPSTILFEVAELKDFIETTETKANKILNELFN